MLHAGPATAPFAAASVATVYLNIPADDGGITIEPALPEIVAKNDDGRPVGAILFCGEAAPENR